MRKGTIKLNETERSLPSIKRHKTTINSTRTIFKESPSNKALFQGSPKAKEISSFGLREPSQRFEQITSKHSNAISPSPSEANLNSKVSNLIKIIEDQDHYIKTLETEFNISKSDFPINSIKNLASPYENEESNEKDSNITKGIQEESYSRIEDQEENILGFLREEGTRNKYKDLEIYKLKKQLEEDKAHIFKLNQDNSSLKKRQIEYDEALAIISKAEKEIQELKSEANNEVKKIEAEICEIDNDLSMKNLDIQEIAELLKRSEEKRNYSNEYNIFMESSSAKLKDRISALAIEKAKIEKQIKEVREKIIEREKVIEELQEKIKVTQEEINEEKQRNAVLSKNYEKSKGELKDSTETYEMQKIMIKEEKERLASEVEEKNSEKSQTNSSDSKKRSRAKDSIADICKEESIKWQQKCTGLEIELSSSREELEKLKKNEIYLQNQLLTKELMISQIESLLQNAEEPEKKLDSKTQQIENPKAMSISELVSLICGMKDRYTVSKEEFRCESCQRLPTECFLTVPCGHLTCSACKNKADSKCAVCSEQSAGLIHSVNMDRIIYNFKKEMETIERAKKLLNVPNF